MLRRRAEPRLEEAEVAAPERDGARGRESGDRERDERRGPAEVATASREQEHDDGGEVDPDQARERGAEDRPDHADHEPRDGEQAGIAAARVDALEPDRGGECREGGEVVLAHERALALLIRGEEADEAPGGRDGREGDDEDEKRAQAFWRVDEDRCSEPEQAELDELAGGRDRIGAVRERGDGDERAECRRRDEQPARRKRSRPQAVQGEDAGREQGDVRDRDVEDAEVDRGKVDGPQQAQGDGDEEDREGGIPRRPPQGSWQLAGHRRQL